MEKLVLFFRVMKAGEEVADPTKWKNVQAMAIALLMILKGVLGYVFPDLKIEDQFYQYLADGISYLLGAVAVYLTYATSKRAGV